MRQTVILLAIASLLLATAASAQLGVGGNTMTQTGTWSENMMLSNGSFVDIDPATMLPTGDPLTWPGLEIDVWVEAECFVSWENFDVDIHRTGNYSDFTIVFPGLSQCNLPVRIITEAPGGQAELSSIPMVAAGAPGISVGNNAIPLTWEWRVNRMGEGWTSWAPYEGTTNTGMFFDINEPCDHQIQIRAIGDMEYHQAAGHYKLGDMNNPAYSICPVEPL
jgi:hypothetical protein